MSPLLRPALLRLSLYVFIGLLVGYQLQSWLLGLTIALWLYIVLNLVNYARLQQWIESGATHDRPLLNRFWQGLADQVYRLISQQRAESLALKEDLEFFKDSFQALDSALIVINGKGVIDWANRAAASVLGVRFERDKGELLINLFRVPAFGKYLKAKMFVDPLVVESPRDARKTLELQVMPFRTNYYLILVRDISDLVKLERVRQDFIANVSHELRTPLTVISGYLETLKDNVENLPPTWNRVFDQMLQQSKRMDNMVTDLLWLSRLEAVPETEHTDKVPVSGLLQGIVTDAKIAAPEKSITLEMSAKCSEGPEGRPLCLSGSYDELRSAFSNLVQNAIKYTGENGQIKVRCDFLGDSFVVCITDNGEGIDPVHIPRLTERFYRPDSSRASSTGGTGLGLAIVKHVLNRHDAELKIVSSPGKGSSFSCVFPANRVTW